MTVEAKDVVKGKCFVTEEGQVRRVIEVTDEGKVNYEARGKEPVSGSWPTKPPKATLPTIERFVADVVEEVKEDHTPE
jgi:hypothetical protein